MNNKAYRLYVTFRPNYIIGPRTTELSEMGARERSKRLAAFTAELVAAGLSDGSYTQPVHRRTWDNYEFAVTNLCAAATLAEKYSADVSVSKPGGRVFRFESYRFVPTWLFPKVTAVQRELESHRYYVVGLINHYIQIADNPDQLQLLKSIEINAHRASDINRLTAVYQRIGYHIIENPEWQWRILPAT